MIDAESMALLRATGMCPCQHETAGKLEYDAGDFYSTRAEAEAQARYGVERYCSECPRLDQIITEDSL